MRSWIGTVGLLLLMVGSSLPVSLRAQDLSGKEIIERADELMRGQTQVARQSMTVVRPSWQRTITFKSWLLEKNDKAFIRILSPAKERGTAFLKLGTEMWQYVPKINRVIKIPPSMMMQSWMGSDFTNDDLVKESSIVEDYNHNLLARDTLRGFTAYKVELMPKPDAAVSWGRILYWVRTDDFVPLRAEYYNQRDERVRTLIFTEIQEMGGRTIPAKMTMVDEKNEGEQTIVEYEDITFNDPIDSSIFTRRNLQRTR